MAGNIYYIVNADKGEYVQYINMYIYIYIYI